MEIFPVDGGNGLIFSKEQILQPVNNGDGQLFWRARFVLKVINYGQIETGPINILLKSNWTDNDYEHIPNIEKQEYNSTIMIVRYKCSLRGGETINGTWVNKECKYDDVFATREVTILVDCDNCLVPKIEKNFTICVWDKEPTECINNGL